MLKAGNNKWFEWFLAICISIITAIGVRIFLLAPVLVEGHSMMPTLNDMDQLIINQMSYYFSEPERFDIVVFKAPEDVKKFYVKRVIGLPGETISYENDCLYVDGNYINEIYLEEYKELITEGYFTETFKLEDKIGTYTIPEGEVFVLGDNRRYSKDSRHFGTVPIKDIYGKGLFVFWPTDNINWIK